MIPNIYTVNKKGKRTQDVFSYEFENNRKINLIDEITSQVSTEIISQLEYLDSICKKNIYLYINCPGGNVPDGLAIIDAIERCQSNVITVCTGIAASMAAVIFSFGTKRYITPYAELMIHQPLGSIAGQAADVELMARHINSKKELLNTLLAEKTGQSIETIYRDTDRDFYLDAEAAIEYGLADAVLTSNLLLT